MDDKSYLQDFRSGSKIIYENKADGIEMWAGDLFEAKTVKGHKNLIFVLRIINGYIFYSHGEKVKKVPLEQFLNAVRHGDLEPKDPKEIDPERLAHAQIGLDAIANRRTAQQQIDYVEAQAMARLSGQS